MGKDGDLHHGNPGGSKSLGESQRLLNKVSNDCELRAEPKLKRSGWMLR